MLNPCGRNLHARTRRFLREKLISGQDLFSSYEGQQGASDRQDACFLFRDLQGFRRVGAGSRAGFTSSRLPPPWNFSYFCIMCGLDKFRLVDQNGLERGLSALLLKSLAVGRRQESESIEVNIHMG